MISRLAPAKINLVLEVLGKRSDGYHEIRTVLQTVSLCDTLTFEPGQGIAVDCDSPYVEKGDNSVLAAARLLQEYAGSGRGVRIGLHKVIPVAAGLGGGSSDAASTLLGLNQLWGLGLCRDRLVELAARIGSDVPFFLYGGTALAQGRGETVIPLPPLPPGWFVLFCPSFLPLPSKTKQLYHRLTPQAFTSGERCLGLAAGLSDGMPLQPGWLYNAFESVAYDFFPGLSAWAGRFGEAARLGAESVHLCGSGPCLYTWAGDEATAGEIQLALRNAGMATYVVQTEPPLPK